MKVKSESEVAQSCPTLSDPMDYSLPGSPVHGIFQARVLEWGANALVLSMKLALCTQRGVRKALPVIKNLNSLHLVLQALSNYMKRLN